MKTNRRHRLLALVVHSSIAAALVTLPGCGSREIKPVEIFPEDNCSHCRMAISDQRFAAEMIDTKGDAYKFDDIGCLLTFMEMRADVRSVGLFVKDYETRAWIPYGRAIIVQSALETPMGSGKLAFADSTRASKFQLTREGGN